MKQTEPLMPLGGATKDENYSPFEFERVRVKKLGGRASWRAVTPASCPMRLGGSLALPISAGLKFFHTFRGCRGMSYGEHGT